MSRRPQRRHGQSRICSTLLWRHTAGGQRGMSIVRGWSFSVSPRVFPKLGILARSHILLFICRIWCLIAWQHIEFCHIWNVTVEMPEGGNPLLHSTLCFYLDFCPPRDSYSTYYSVTLRWARASGLMRNFHGVGMEWDMGNISVIMRRVYSTCTLTLHPKPDITLQFVREGNDFISRLT